MSLLLVTCSNRLRCVDFRCAYLVNSHFACIGEGAVVKYVKVGSSNLLTLPLTVSRNNPSTTSVHKTQILVRFGTENAKKG